MFRALSAVTVGAIVFAIVAVVCIVITVGSSEEEMDVDDISHGLGHHINWHTLEEGLILAKEENKPLMLIIHKSWCGACRSLIPKLKESKEMEKISTNFIMVNTQDNDEPPEDTYRPDGGYIPRILFFDPEGSLQKDVINEDGNPQYKYYYYDADSVLNSMKKVSKMFPLLGSSEEDVDKNENAEGKRNSNLSEATGSEKIEL